MSDEDKVRQGVHQYGNERDVIARYLDELGEMHLGGEPVTEFVMIACSNLSGRVLFKTLGDTVKVHDLIVEAHARFIKNFMPHG